MISISGFRLSPGNIEVPRNRDSNCWISVDSEHVLLHRLSLNFWEQFLSTREENSGKNARKICEIASAVYVNLLNVRFLVLDGPDGRPNHDLTDGIQIFQHLYRQQEFFLQHLGPLRLILLSSVAI
jgi:hypothetical protein